MIEQIMYFMLGVLMATLVALLVLPAVWHRAVRLTTRRVEAAVPVSMFEVQAEKDQQRAFFALNQRRLELQTDAMRETIVSHAAAIEAQRQQIFDLEAARADLAARRDLLEATGAERDVLLGETQDLLADRTAALARLEGEHRARLADLQRLTADLAQVRAQAADLAATLKAREETIADRQARIAALEAELALVATNLQATAQRLDDTTLRLAGEQEALAAATGHAQRLTAQIDGLTATLEQRTRESEARAAALADAEAERGRLAAEIDLLKQDLDASRAVLHAFEQRRASEFAAAEAEAKHTTDTLHRLQADHALMQGALASARGSDPIPVTPDVLKTALADLAAQVVAMTARREGAASPIRTLLGPAGGDETLLAARVRALLEQDEPAETHPAQAGGETAARPEPVSPPARAASA